MIYFNERKPKRKKTCLTKIFPISIYKNVLRSRSPTASYLACYLSIFICVPVATYDSTSTTRRRRTARYLKFVYTQTFPLKSNYYYFHKSADIFQNNYLIFRELIIQIARHTGTIKIVYIRPKKYNPPFEINQISILLLNANEKKNCENPNIARTTLSLFYMQCYAATRSNLKLNFRSCGASERSRAMRYKFRFYYFD